MSLGGDLRTTLVSSGGRATSIGNVLTFIIMFLDSILA